MIRPTSARALSVLLASSVGLALLAGCQAPSPTGARPGQSMPAGQAQEPAAASAQTAEAMAEEREMDDYAYAVDEGGAAAYQLAAAGDRTKAGARADAASGIRAQAKANVRAEVRAKLKERLAKVKAKAKARVDRLKEAAKLREVGKSAAWVAGEDGTETQTIATSVEKTVNGTTFVRSVSMVRVRRTDDKVLVSAKTEFKHTLPNGASRTSTREKALQEDGSYKIVFHSEQTLPNGTKRVADWEKTISADGVVSGTGTIVVTLADGTVKTTTITLKGTEEAPAADASATGGATATVTVPVDGEPEASVGGVEIDLDAAAGAEAGTPSPAPSASAAPDASPSPDASAEASGDEEASAEATVSL